MLENLEFWINFIVLALLIGVLLSLWVFQPPISLDFDELFEKMKNSNAGVASGTARQKKVADTLLGQAIMEQYPIVQMATQIYPPLGDFISKNPNMVPYIASTLMQGVAKAGDKLPEGLQQLAAGMINQNLTQKPTFTVEEE